MIFIQDRWGSHLPLQSDDWGEVVRVAQRLDREGLWGELALNPEFFPGVVRISHGGGVAIWVTSLYREVEAGLLLCLEDGRLEARVACACCGVRTSHAPEEVVPAAEVGTWLDKATAQEDKAYSQAARLIAEIATQLRGAK